MANYVLIGITYPLRPSQSFEPGVYTQPGHDSFRALDFVCRCTGPILLLQEQRVGEVYICTEINSSYCI